MVMILSVKQDEHLTLEFAYSPFFEMLCSLHVLAKPEHHLERLGWAEGMKADMTNGLYEELMYLGKTAMSGAVLWICMIYLTV
jgi:hypothetical protein